MNSGVRFLLKVLALLNIVLSGYILVLSFTLFSTSIAFLCILVFWFQIRLFYDDPVYSEENGEIIELARVNIKSINGMLLLCILLLIITTTLRISSYKEGILEDNLLYYLSISCITFNFLFLLIMRNVMLKRKGKD